MDKLLPIVKLNEEHFERPDGSKYAKIFGSPIRYYSKGKLKHIRDFKIDTVADEYISDSDDFKFKIKKNKLVYTYGGKTHKSDILGLYVDDTLIQEPQGSPTIEGNVIVWNDIFNGVDLKIELSPYSARDIYTIKSNPILGKPLDGQYLWVKHKVTGKPRTRPAYANDAKGRNVLALGDYSKKGIPVKALYTYTYPIVLDPTTSPIPVSDALLSYHSGSIPAFTKVDATTLDLYYGYFDDGCGTSWSNPKNAYLKFDLTSMAGKTINSALLKYYILAKTYSNDTISIRQVTSELDPETVATQGEIQTAFNACSGTQIATESGANGLKQATVTTYVNSKKGGSCSFGMVKATAYMNSTVSIASSEYAVDTAKRPFILIDYTDAGGTTYFGIVKRFNGSAWVKAKVKPYVAGSFVTGKKVKRWNGTAWVEVDGTGV